MLSGPRMLVALLIALMASTAGARERSHSEEAALTTATRAWKALNADLRKRQHRDRWQKVIGRLEQIGHSKTSAATRALALYRAGEATEDMSLVSRRRKDAEAAEALYVEAARFKTSVAADALNAAAEIERERLGAPQKARALRVQAKALARSETPKVVHEVAPKVAREVPRKAEASETDTTVAMVEALDASPKAERAPEPPVPTEASAPELRRLKKTVMAETAVSLSEQAGLKIKRIVVDAGHGGKDDGATGPKGAHEKDVTLGIARSLATALRSRGYEVVLTRDSDRFVELEDRTAIANREKGDLFISIHANAAPSHKLNGIETYALNIASNRFAARLAARENATSNRSVSELQYLLADLATRANTIDSDRFADYVETNVISGVARRYSRPKELGVKHALFYVLLGAKMPAVLVETGFISNPTEEKRLASPTYQSVVAQSIARAVDQFVARRRQFASAVP